LQHAGQTPDPKAAQIERLKADIDKLNARLAQANSTIEQLSDFRTQALARLAAQHDEITRLRASATVASRVTRLPQRATSVGSCS
jgi:predicted  nucleic acid-binding Zn-ribbon protein